MSVKVCVVRIEGSYGANEASDAFSAVGAKPEMVHLKQLSGNCPADMRRSLEGYDVLVLPSGMAGGNYVRPGAILAARIKTQIGKEMEAFVESGKSVLGIGSGFQTLVELGILPSGNMGKPTAAFIANSTGAYECRPAYVECLKSKCDMLSKVPKGKPMYMPFSQLHGGIAFAGRRDAAELLDNKQVPFVYVKSEGADRKSFWNPSGIPEAIAALCNPAGNVLGIMPQPQRALSGYSEPGWTRGKPAEKGYGLKVFESIVKKV